MKNTFADLASSSNRAVRRPASIGRELVLMVLGFARGRHDARADIRPRTTVQGLLLDPTQLGVGILVEMRRDLDKAEL